LSSESKRQDNRFKLLLTESPFSSLARWSCTVTVAVYEPNRKFAQKGARVQKAGTLGATGKHSTSAEREMFAECAMLPSVDRNLPD
jgi:hypothetical protein